MSEVVYLNPKRADQVSTPRDGGLALFVDPNGVLQAMDQHRRVIGLGALPQQFGVYTLSLVDQGDTGESSLIKIECRDLAGNLIGVADRSGMSLDNSDDLLRVGVFNDGTHTQSTNATIAVARGSTLVQTLTSGKDLVISPDATQLTTALSGSNNDLIFRRKETWTGGNPSIAYVNPGTASASESVTVSGDSITFNLATGTGTAQTETAAVTAAAGATEAGTLNVVFVSAATGTVNVPVALITDDDTATKVADKIAAALDANATIKAHWDVENTGANVIATSNDTPAAVDSTANISWGAYIAGVSATASSTPNSPAAPAITSTGDTIKATLLASADASLRVTAEDASGNDGSGTVTAMSATPLTVSTSRVYYVALTDAETETVTLRLGPPPFGGIRAGDYSDELDVTHAAP